jgi:hypothetical protein
MTASEFFTYLVKPVQFYFENYHSFYSAGGAVGLITGTGIGLSQINPTNPSYKGFPLGNIAESAVLVTMTALGGTFIGSTVMATLPVTIPVSVIYGLKKSMSTATPFRK